MITLLSIVIVLISTKEFCKTVENGSTLVKNEDGTIKGTFLDGFKGGCEGPTPARWTAYTKMVAKGTFSNYISNFEVPEKPNYPAVRLYLFPGLENVEHKDLLQIVLQYNAGKQWNLRCWYVSWNESAAQSVPIDVEPGDIILANLTKLDEEGTYFCGAAVKDQPSQQTSFTLKKPALHDEHLAFIATEISGSGECKEYPDSPFELKDIAIFDGEYRPVALEWEKTIDTECVTSIDVGEKDVKFNFLNDREV